MSQFVDNMKTPTNITPTNITPINITPINITPKTPTSVKFIRYNMQQYITQPLNMSKELNEYSKKNSNIIEFRLGDVNNSKLMTRRRSFSK